MDAIQEEFGMISDGGEERYILGRPIAWKASRTYSYDSERSILSSTNTHRSDLQYAASPKSSYRPLSPRILRSQVSLDALPEGTTTPPRTSIRSSNSARSFESTSSQDAHTPTRIPLLDGQGRLSPRITQLRGEELRRSLSLGEGFDVGHGSPITSLLLTPTQRVFNDDTPGPSRSPRHHRHAVCIEGLVPGPAEAVQDDVQSPTIGIADETLRSTPGVRGLGEGWTGGPEPKTRSGWWKKSKKKDDTDTDPLSLWDQHSRQDQPKRSMERSSPRISFGRSLPHLPIDMKRQSMNTTLNFDKPPERHLFSMSTTALNSLAASRRSQSNPSILIPSRSSSLSRSSARRRSPKKTNDPLDVTDSILTDTQERKVSGPRPPWRPSSSVITPTPSLQTKASRITKAEQDDFDSCSLAAVIPESNAPPVLGPPVQDLRRTSTFGTGDIASEQGYRTPRQRDSLKPIKTVRLNDSVVGFDTIDQWAQEPKAKIRISRSRSIFSKLRLALSPVNITKTSSRSQSSTSPLKSPLKPLKALSRSKSLSKKPRGTDISAPLESKRLSRRTSEPSIVALVTEDADIPARPSTSMGMRAGRRSSWMAQKGEDWKKRISTLIEGDDEEPKTSPSRPTSPFNSFSNFNAFNTFGASKQKVEENGPSRSSSFLFRVLPSRSSSNHQGQAEKIKRRTRLMASMSTPDIHLARYSTVDLDVGLDLPEDQGLGLDDIIIDSKRQSIIQALDLDKRFDFPIPPSRQHSQSFIRRDGSRRSHSRNKSEVTPSLTSGPTVSTSTSRSISLTRSGSFNIGISQNGNQRDISEESSTVPGLDHTLSEKASSLFPQTPLMPTSDILRRYTHITTPKSLNARSANTSPGSLVESFYSAQEDLTKFQGDGLLTRVKSEESEFSDMGDVVHASISRVSALGGKVKADLVDVKEIGSRNGSL